MVTRDGRAKILDFGLAKAEAVSPDDATQTAFASEAGAVMGTVGYMAPEQVRGHKVDPRTGIFSFGALLYELLSGTRPFHRATAADTMSAILKDDPPDLPEGVPSGLRQIVFRCVEKEPLRRFQSAQDLAFALRALGGSGTSSSAITQAIELPKEKPRVASALAIAACIAGLVLGALALNSLRVRRSFGRRTAPASICSSVTHCGPSVRPAEIPRRLSIRHIRPILRRMGKPSCTL